MSRHRRQPNSDPGLAARIDALGADDLAALLGAVPCLADAVEGRGPLAPSWPYGFGRDHSLDRSGLARLLAAPGGAEFLVLSLDARSLALAQLAVWHGGAVSRQTALDELPTVDRAELDITADVLHRRLLTEPDAGWVTLRPAAIGAVDLPGLPAAPAFRYVNSDVLADKLLRLGRTPPSRKTERITALVDAMRDPDTIIRVVDDLPAPAARALELLIEHGPQRVEDLGEPHWPPYGYRRQQPSAIGTLIDHGLIGVDTEQQTCLVWLDVLVGLNGGRLFGDAFPSASAPTLRVVPGAARALPPVLEQLDALLEHWRARPADALAAGGLGVRPVRAAAKALGLTGPHVGLLAVLAAEIGLLGVVERGATGRGRNRRTHRQWAPTALVDQWNDRSPAWRWALLVDTWRHSPRLVELEGLPERYEPHGAGNDATAVASRSAWLLLLAALPDGQGVAGDDIVDLAADRYPMLLGAPGRVEAMLAVTRVLGLLAPEGPIALTTLGRAVLGGPDAVEELLPPPDDQVVVQADHTIVAPPDAGPDVTATLTRWADLESATGARIYRLSERRLTAALATDTEDEIIGWLKEHSRVGIPQNVEYLIRDVARRRDRMRAGATSSYLRSDDAALLTRAVSVRAAKLRVLAPTVAVSALPRTKLVAALTDAGVAVVAEDADGAVVEASAPQAERVGWHHTGDGLPALRGAASPAELAARLTADGRQQTLPAADDGDDPLSRLRRRQRRLDGEQGHP